MIVELRQKSQITIPAEVVSSMGLTQGDKFEVIEKDGVISLIPVTVYPKKYVEDLQSEISLLKEQIASGKRKTFTSVDDMFDDLNAED